MVDTQLSRPLMITVDALKSQSGGVVTERLGNSRSDGILCEQPKPEQVAIERLLKLYLGGRVSVNMHTERTSSRRPMP